MKTFRKRRQHSSVFYRRRRRRNYVPLITFLIAFCVVVWLGARFFSMLFSDIRSEAASMELQILKGRAEFTFSESDEWTPAYSEQKFLEGDSIRTSNNTRASLEFLGGNMIFMNENSEIQILELDEKSSGKKNVVLLLKKGDLWTHASGDDFADESKSKFSIETSRAQVHVRGTIFDLSSNISQDTLRLIKGSVDVDVFHDGEKEEFTNVNVGVGQKLVVSNASIEQLQANQDILEIIDTDFIYSEWHLQNLERFSPQEATQIRRRIEVSAVPQATTDEDNMKVSDDLESPNILLPADGTRVPASAENVKIEGTAPLKAVQIVVNGYTLTRFQPGDRKWAYFGATKFGTLLPGENKYSVIAISRDGKKSAPAEVTVFYEGEGSEVPAEGGDIVSTIDEFKAPVITRPAIIDEGEPYQTSSEIVTIMGLVDPKTNGVEVNGFRLKKFRPGQTEFSYIANARYDNMKEGENVYEIVAFGPDGKKATKSITIVYSPINVDSE
jgi:hypothetical protein